MRDATRLRCHGYINEMGVRGTQNDQPKADEQPNEGFFP